MDFTSAKFAPSNNSEFFATLKKRIKGHFKSKNISPTANGKMIFKTVFMISLYFGTYLFMLLTDLTNFWVFFTCYILMALGVSGIGLSVMHDANHGAYSRKKSVNSFVGYVLNFIGGNVPNWKMQHNILHHSFTNVDGIDEDLSPGPLLRFSPHQKKYKFHKLQHIYAWFFYGLMTLSWVTLKEFLQIFRYKKSGIIKTQGRSFSSLFIELLFSKVIYYVYMIVLPLVFLPIPWHVILLLFIMMNFIAGFILAVIFQAAHVMPTSEYPLPDENGGLENDWAVHQLNTTTNFSPSSSFFSWFIGGLNYQIEHHLFPNICHIHYRDISKIVMETAKEFNLPYNSIPNFRLALVEHTKMLKKLGR